MKTIEDINLYTFFSNRSVLPIPHHFVRTKIKITEEIFYEVQEQTTGRYSLYNPNDSNYSSGALYLAFEDSKDAIFFELKYG